MDYGALIQAIVGIVGEAMASGDKAKAQALLERMQTQFAGIPLPSLQEIQAQQLGPSAMQGIKTDPTLAAAQNDALGQLGDVSENGLADVDKAALNKIANQVALRQKAGMANIEGDMAARGQAGTGLDYGARMQNASDANQRLSEEGQNVGAEALQRRFQAMLGRGDLAGRMRGQQFSEQAQKAQASDLINRLNAASRSQADYYNHGIPQQNFANQMQKTGAMANPTNALAGFKVQSGNDTRNAFAGYGAAAGQFVDSAANNQNSNNWGSSNLDGYGTGSSGSDEEDKRRGRKLYDEEQGL